MSRRSIYVALAWLGALALAGTARAEWATQSITLHPGWNAVFVEVQPDDNTCDTVFAGVPIKSVWKWNRKIQLKQFVKNPSELIPKTPDWLIHFPKGEARSFLSDLFAINAGQPYLIELGGTQDVTWAISGRVTTKALEWLPDSFNLAGFYLDPAVQVSFKDFLQHDKALAGQVIYRVAADGTSVQVDPAKDKMKAGEAFWVYSAGASSYAGPFSAAPESVQGLDFSKEFSEGALLVTNATGAEKNITVRVLPSQRPPAGKSASDLPPLAGDVALSYSKLIGWAPLENKLEFKVGANSTQRLPLAVRRRDMAPMSAKGSKSTVAGQYESVLQVTDGSGGLFFVPAKAVVDSSPTGLWVGEVKLDKVSEVARPNDLTTTPASSEFTFRVIIHVDELGNTSLLQKVYLLKSEEQVDDSVPPRVVRPEEYVLITQDSLLNGLTGVSIRDGKFVGRRISSPAFGEVDLNNDGEGDPSPMVGNFVPGSTVTASLSMDYQDPKNPFVHLFHPDHDNLDERFENTISEGRESYSFTRALTLTLLAQDPEQLGLPEWGDTLVGGTYREEITGVHKRTIRVEGTFRLTRVSRIGTLNDVP